MRGCVRAPPVLRRSRFGCAVWACVLAPPPSPLFVVVFFFLRRGVSCRGFVVSVAGCPGPESRGVRPPFPSRPGCAFVCAWGLGDQEVLRLHTSGTTESIRAASLVQAADLGEGVRDFLFDAFLHVARHDRPSLAAPDGQSPPPTGSRIWVPPIDWGQHLVGHPMPGRVDTKSCTRYQEPNVAHPP